LEGKMKRVVIGPTPLNEAASMGRSRDIGRRVAEIFARQLVRLLGAPPRGANVTVEKIRHGRRNVYCAVCNYDETDDRAFEYAYRCEDEAPLEWDEVARDELARVTKERDA
jgi:hypothetical protein